MDHEGLEPGARMRTRHMRGSTALSYEPDVVLILATKSDIVARHHLMYGGANAEHFKEWSVLTVEKNRSGSGGAEIEFKKRFDQGRFDTERPGRHREARRRARLRRVTSRRARRRRRLDVGDRSERPQAAWTRRAGRRPDPTSERPGHLTVTGPFDVRAQLSSAAVTLRVRLGSTGTPGPMVVETVTFRRYLPLELLGLSRSTSSSAAA